MQVVGSCWEDSGAAVGDSVAYMQICVCGVGAANVFSRTTKVACADVAQLVAHHLAKVRVASSSLVIRSGSSAIALGGAFCMSAGLIDTTMMH